jgi:hypothetical protein
VIGRSSPRWLLITADGRRGMDTRGMTTQKMATSAGTLRLLVRGGIRVVVQSAAGVL